MKKYSSNEEFFIDFQKLIKKIQSGGNSEAVEELTTGFSCLNGLTDGWAILMESIEKLYQIEIGICPKHILLNYMIF